ncbi:hypothetical protein CCH79_00003327 [Gambusia affinis]|uniref:Cyclin-dependent kinase 5 activator 1 n=1 Tax=Gambusia affinis TaxID=33528 RepID=A0A315VFP8_GAMAF|nr:hypothetical protein CCH79_00003327 [Gambusia affinis]
MGTVLSLSPSYRKAALFEDGPATVGHYTAVQNSKNAKDKNLKRHSLINVLPWKRIVAVSAKKKSSKKVQPNATYQNNVSHLNNENLKKSQSCANLSSFTQDQNSPALSKGSNNTTSSVKKAPLTNSNVAPGTPKRVIVQASTSELLRCLGEFLCRRCYRLKHLSPTDPVLWLRSRGRFFFFCGDAYLTVRGQRQLDPNRSLSFTKGDGGRGLEGSGRNYREGRRDNLANSNHTQWYRDSCSGSWASYAPAMLAQEPIARNSQDVASSALGEVRM